MQMIGYKTTVQKGDLIMVNVQIDEDELLDMLVDRVKVWRDNQDTIDLYTDMYKHMIDDGCFDGMELNIMSIVDNDIVNWCSVISDGDDDFDKVKELAEQDEYDISCETIYSCIEAKNLEKGIILVRH